ncbi:MAG: ABC-2 family transporter protein [Caulobacteraceae bacterium]
MKSTLLTARRPPSGVFGGEIAAAWRGLVIGAGATAAGWPVLIGRCLFYTVIMVVQAALWDTVMAVRLPGTLAASLPDGALVLYVAATEWITLSLPALHLKLEDDIRSGGLEAHLLRPKGYLLQTMAQSLGGGLVRLGALGVTAGILLLVSGRAAPPIEAVAFLAVLGPLALTVGVLLYTLAGLSAFWARKVLPVQLVIQKLMFLAGGLFAPISLYPEPWAAIVKATPFAAHLYWAGRQVLAPSLDAFAWGVGWCLLWIALLGGLCELIWRAGLGRVRRGEI